MAPGPSPPWHALFAPLPPDAVPRQQPVATPEILATPAGAAIAGWRSLVLDLSAGASGLRVIHAVLDQAGQLLSASDMVLYRLPSPGPAGSAPVQLRQESVGGRFEPDGSFRGTRWLTLGPEPDEGEEPRWDSTPTPATSDDAAALRAVAAELLRRRPPDLLSDPIAP